MLIPAARINKLFGTEGGLSLTLYPVFPEEFDLSMPLFAQIDALDVPLYCERFERRGKTGALAHFADIDTERRALELISRELYIEESQDSIAEDQDDTFYMEDMIGFRAEAEGLAGEVTDYYDNKANPLFEVTTDEAQTVLIPAAEEFISYIDFEGRTIGFILPEGLAELNSK